MNPVKSLESIVRAVNISPPVHAFRLSPTGALLGMAGAGLLGGGFFLIIQNPILARMLGGVAVGIGSISSYLSFSLYKFALEFYATAKNKMNEVTDAPGLESFFRYRKYSTLYEYCPRQAYHAVAVKLGLGKEYVDIRDKLTPRDMREWPWLPGV